MIRARRNVTPKAKPQADNTADSIFQDEKYHRLTGQAAGKASRIFPETKFQAAEHAKAEFNRRKLVKHETAFVEGYVSTVRGGFFASNSE